MHQKIIRLLQRIPLSHELTAGGFIVVFIALIAASAYGYTRIVSLNERLNQLSRDLALTTEVLHQELSNATTTIENSLRLTRQNVQDQIVGVKEDVTSITGTVTDLEKLTKMDPELLTKYSKVFFLNENYAPARLAEIPPQYLYNESKNLQLIPEVLAYLSKMLDAAKSDGVDIYVYSAYRSFETQEALKGQYRITYGAGTANSFSADQGYSEHQLGTTVDLITTGTGGALTGFDKKPAYEWLLKNAYRFGFVLSYPKNNAYYIFEPWHWRFVGVKLATELHEKDISFYNMDQRVIDTYIISLFD